MNWFLYYVFYRIGKNNSSPVPRKPTTKGADFFGCITVFTVYLFLSVLCLSSGIVWLACVFAFCAFIMALIALASI